MRNTSRSTRFGASSFSSTRRTFGVTYLSALALVVAVGCGQGNGEIIGGGGSSGSRGGNGGSGNGGAPGFGGSGPAFTLPPQADAGPTLPGGGYCGDGILERAELCDDGNTQSGDGCSASCQIEANWECPEQNKPCKNMAVCGNGRLTSNETCDDGNTQDNDGCSADCKTITEGWTCPVPGKKCIPKCGDGKIINPETCDDGNADGGDGCSVTCQTEPGYDCKEAGKACIKSECGNGKVETGELCDCGTDPSKLPSECKAVNGLFYGDGTGCSKTCTKEPSCIDKASGKTRACDSICGDGNVDANEECDDGNQANGDGCSSTCKKEQGFSCESKTSQDSTTCQSGSGTCLQLPIIYRDFQPENTKTGGHPDFYFLGTRYNGSKSSTTVCVPNSGGPAKGNDSTKRCWGIMGDSLLNGKPQPGATRTCDCQFSDWNIGNSSRIPGGYTQAANDSPLSDGAGAYLGGAKGSAVSTTSTTGPYAGTLKDYTSSTPGGPIFAGTTPAYKDASSFKQWYNDDKTVNTSFTGVLEMTQIGSNLYQYSSKSHLMDGGFYPLDGLNSSQKTLCNMWPYWNHGDGTAIWSKCSGDQYLFPPRIVSGDCGSDVPAADLTKGCWITGLTGQLHDNYFTDEARYYFVYDGDAGISLKFYGDDDLFIFINGVLVLDLGGVHQQLPGNVTVKGNPGDATVVEGGCLDSAGNIIGATAGSSDCSPTNSKPAPPTATSGDDFRNRTVPLGLKTGSVYEIAIFGADRHPPESNYQLTLSGFATKQSACQPRCGDGVATNGEQCDCGDGTGTLPEGCTGPNNDDTYGGCTTKCTYGPFCGDGNVQTEHGGSEECDRGKDNGNTDLGRDGCTLGCMKPHFCGDGIPDPGEACDLGDKNGKKLDSEHNPSDDGIVFCKDDCSIPDGVVF